MYVCMYVCIFNEYFLNIARLKYWIFTFSKILKSFTTVSSTVFQKAPEDVIDLITVCFHFNPARRPSAVELLQHVFVSEFHNEEEVCRNTILEITNRYTHQAFNIRTFDKEILNLCINVSALPYIKYAHVLYTVYIQYIHMYVLTA
jgi:serine/threonine protein kinase